MGFEGFCATVFALLVGTAIAFGGYRWFLILLPIWGFFFGFAVGAEAMQAIFGEAFLATVTSWVVGFIVAALFAVLSYLVYGVGVALVAGSLGYGLGVGFMNLIGIDFGVLAWLVGIVAGAILLLVTFRFDLQRYVIIVTTAIGGAGIIVITLMFGYTGLTLANLVDNPIQFALNDSVLWTLFFFAVTIIGMAVQAATTRGVVIEPYDSRIYA
jgi:hypothetical protein